jgi:hypothetical protein
VPVSHEGSPLDVNLPKVGIGTGKPGKDPNLATGDVIVYTFTEGGDAYCVSDYSDDPIGTVKMWVGDTNIPFGWENLNWHGLIPVGVDSSQSSEPDIATVGDADNTGTFGHTHTQDGSSEGNLDHTDDIDPTPGLGHDNMAHTDGILTDPGLSHEADGIPGLDHSDSDGNDVQHILNHTVTGDANDFEPAVSDGDGYETHSESNTGHSDLAAHTIKDHTIDTHLTNDHTIDSHVIPVEPHYPSMMPVIFIVRIHE